MALTLAEGLIGQLKTYIEANLPAKLNALDTAYNDGITLDDTVATYLGIKSLKSIPAYPALYIFSPSSRFRAMTVVPGTTQAVGEAKPEIAVGIVVTEQDAEKLQKRLYRYGRALLELMLDGLASATALGGWTLSTDEEWETDTLTAMFSDSSESSFVGEITLTMRALKIEQK